MKSRFVVVVICIGLIVLVARGRSDLAPDTTSRDSNVATSLTKNENKCIDAGWKKVITTIGGNERQLLYKGPADAWKGSIIVMHGGGGDYTQWCYTSAPVNREPQVDFSNLAVSRGFGVFLLDSTNDVVTDANGRLCGKRFDATVVDGRHYEHRSPVSLSSVIKEIDS
jgi:hypothetical protein